MIKRIIKLAFLVLFLINIIPFTDIYLTAEESSNNSINPDWIKIYDDSNRSITYETSFYSSKEDQLYVVTKSLNFNNTGYTKSFLLFQINKNGDLVNSKEIIVPDSKIYAVDYFEVNNENNFILFVESEEKLLLVKISYTGEVITSKDIINYSYRSKHFKIKKITNTNYYLIFGHIGFESLYIVVDKNGEIVLKKNFNIGNRNLLVDVLIDDANKNYYVVGNSGNYENTFMGQSELWFGKLNSSGEIVKSLKFPGRNGSVTKNKNGNYLLTFDKSTSIDNQIWVKTFDADLNEINNASIFSNPNPIFNVINIIGLNVIQSQNIGYHFVGSKELSVSVSLFNANNELITSYWDSNNDKSIGLDYTYETKDTFYIFSKVAQRKKLKEKNKFLNTIKLRIMKFKKE